MVVSGVKVTLVPFLLELSRGAASSIKFPASKVANLERLSRFDSTLKADDKAFTAFVPTPLSPTDFLKARESYLPPVFILETTSTTLLNGIPRP